MGQFFLIPEFWEGYFHLQKRSVIFPESQTVFFIPLAMQMGTSERMIQEHYGHDQILDYEDELAGGEES